MENYQKLVEKTSNMSTMGGINYQTDFLDLKQNVLIAAANISQG